jgi:acyl-CoA thioester hydrolase
VYESYVRVRFNEVDSLGHVNNAVYLVYLEQAAIDHAVAAGLGVDRLAAFGGAFLAYRHEIVYLRPAFAGDVLRILTWLGESQGARVTRFYVIVKDEEPHAPSVFGKLRRGRDVVVGEAMVVRASTEWVFANTRGRPQRIPPELMRLFQGPE